MLAQRSSAAENRHVERERWRDGARGLAPVVALAALATVFRLYDLGFRSLWLDEIATAQAVRLPDLASVLAYVGRDPSATPLTYVVTWLARPLGVDEWAIRLPYAAAGVGAVIALSVLAARLYGSLTGLVAGAFLAVLPYAIYYGQEARSYAFLMLFTTAMMVAAYGAAHRGRALDWVLLAGFGLLDLYTGYLAIAVVIAAYGYVGLVLSIEGARRWRTSGLRAAWATSGRQLRMGALSVALVAVGFLPWARHLVAFIENRGQAFGRVASDYQPTLDEARALLQQLDLHGILLWLLVAGIASSFVDLAFGRWRRSLLPLTWFFVPLLGFLLGTGGGIVTVWPRYFGAVYPAAILLAAAGVAGLARATLTALRVGRVAANRLRGRAMAPMAVRLPRRVAAGTTLVVMAGLSLLVAFDAIPAAAQAYTRAKGSDYRGAVDVMLADDPARPVVLVVGDNPDWTVDGLDYYAWARGSRLAVIDALKLNAGSITTLEAATSVWAAALATPGVTDPTSSGLQATAFTDIWIVRPGAGSAGPIATVRSILEWAGTFEPRLAATAKLLDYLRGAGTLGPELLPPPAMSQPQDQAPPLERWILQPGASLSAETGGFDLEPAGGSVNVYLTTTTLAAGRPYVLAFSCQASGLRGSANVFVVAGGPSGQEAFPDGAGYACLGSTQPDEGVVAFTMPDDATSVTLWLRATGTGSATYAQVSLRGFE